MARVAKPEEQRQKRGEILDAAQRLIYSLGYERMAIQDLLDELKISKGAFYHYFDSKQAVLEALVERMSQAAAQTILPIAQEPGLTALEKFRRYFEFSARWKSHQKPLIMSLLRMWHSDENLRIRQKLGVEYVSYMSQFLTPIIRQGISEKVFDTKFPEQVAIIIAGLALSLSDSMVNLLISATAPADEHVLQQVELLLTAYVDSIERILGAPAGSLDVFGPGAFKEWFVAEPARPGRGSRPPRRKPSD